MFVSFFAFELHWFLMIYCIISLWDPQPSDLANRSVDETEDTTS